MGIKVIKRDGRQEEFCNKKIKDAVNKAFLACGKKTVEGLVETISKKIFDKESVYVEEIQDLTEKAIAEVDFEVAKEFIIYRNKHKEIRDTKNSSDVLISMIEGYLDKSDWRVKENANVGYSFAALNHFISQEVSKEYWKKLYGKTISDAHSTGKIHISDMGYISPYCLGLDLQQLLIEGYNGVDGKVATKPAKHLKTALDHLTNFFFTMTTEAAGAVAVSSFDTLLAPYVRVENLSYKDVKQAMQSFIFNMNVPTRASGQTPFSNITLDVVPSVVYKDQNAWAGELCDFTYGDLQEEMDLINHAFYDIMIEGDADGRMFPFPIPTINIGKSFDWERPIVDKIVKSSAKFGNSYFANFVNSDMNEEDARSMCCRLRLDLTEIKKRGGGLFGANPATGSIGVVTINLSQIGYKAKNYNELHRLIEETFWTAVDSLEIKRKVIEHNCDNGLYPYFARYHSSVKGHTDKWFTNHFSTIGVNGGHEMCVNFLGKGIETDEGRILAESVLDFINTLVKKAQEKTGNMYNLEATPAEGTSHRLALLDKNTFKDIYVSGEGDSVYYTGATLLPVEYSDDPFLVAEHQNKLQTKYSSGTVTHFFFGEKVNPDNLKMFLQSIVNSYEIPYISFTPTFSVCKEHGYKAGEHFICDKCGKEMEVWSRVVGFYRPVQNYNNGKKAEYHLRKTFNKGLL